MYIKSLPNTNIKSMQVTYDEAESLSKAHLILTQFQMAVGGENVVMSVDTGEVITPGDIARARAILDFVESYHLIEVNPK